MRGGRELLTTRSFVSKEVGFFFFFRCFVFSGGGGGELSRTVGFSCCMSRSHQLFFGHCLCDFVPYNC